MDRITTAFFSRKPLCVSTRENVPIDPPREVQDLQTEMTMSDKEWAKSFKDKQDQVNELRTRMNNDHQIMYGDMDYIVRGLLNEMVDHIVVGVNRQKRHLVIDDNGQKRQKRVRSHNH